MTTRLYKWMLPGLVTPTQRKTWPVAVGEWTPRETPVLCESGWHGVLEKDVLEEHLPLQLGAQLWVVEAEGIVHGRDKFTAERMRLVECIGSTDEKNLRLFACDVAEDVLDLFEDEFPNDSRPRNAIEVARRFTNGEATPAEAAAAGDAAGARRLGRRWGSLLQLARGASREWVLMSILRLADQVIVNPRTITLSALDWESVYHQLCVAREDWATLAFYNVGDFKKWCESQREECADLADKINLALSTRKVAP